MTTGKKAELELRFAHNNRELTDAELPAVSGGVDRLFDGLTVGSLISNVGTAIGTVAMVVKAV
jgi:hypothetical protein